MALVIAKDVLAYKKALSIKLQGRYIDVVSAYNQISFVKTTLQCARNDIDTVHTRIYETALEIATKVGLDESMPTVSRLQQHHANVPSSDPSEYYKRALTTPTLDHLITEMDERFHHDSAPTVCQIMLILPSTLAEGEEVLTYAMISDLIHIHIMKITCQHLPSIDTELHCWGVKWQGSHFALLLNFWQSSTVIYFLILKRSSKLLAH